jgi:hypothetical protein
MVSSSMGFSIWFLYLSSSQEDNILGALLAPYTSTQRASHSHSIQILKIANSANIGLFFHSIIGLPPKSFLIGSPSHFLN